MKIPFKSIFLWLLVVMGAWQFPLSLNAKIKNHKSVIKPAVSEEILYYWNFNDVSQLIKPVVEVVAASIEGDLATGSELISGTGQNFFGENAQNGDPAGAHLRLNNPIDSRLIFKISTIGYQDILFRYETRRSGSGAGIQKISYTTNGIDYLPFNTVNVLDDTPIIITLDFSSITDVNNAPNFAIRFEFEQGDGGTVGNNRFDNVTVDGSTYEGDTERVLLVSPLNNAMNIPLMPEFTWHDILGTYNYYFELSTAEDFSITSNVEIIAATTYQLSYELDLGTIYFWRVRPTDDTEWSVVRKFYTIPPPPGNTSTLLPLTESSGVELRPTFEWTEADYVMQYQLQISNTPEFSFLIADIMGIEDASQKLNINLDENTSYYWRIRAQNSAGDGNWSEISSFATLESFPAYDIRLNEVMASNNNTLADEDGDYEDWIEIYNQGELTLNLNGFGLSDDSSSPFKWIFPDIDIQPGEFIIVWASDKNRNSSGATLHANFKISADGESVFITSPDGVTIDESPAISLSDDESFGRYPNGRGPWVLGSEPTPLAGNSPVMMPFSITHFKYEVQHNKGKLYEEIICDIYGDSLIVGIIPYQHSEFELKPTFLAGSASSVTVNGNEQQSQRTSNDFSSHVYYTISSGDTAKVYKVMLIYTGLPVVYITTRDQMTIASKDDYVSGVVKVYSNEESEGLFTAPMEIRGRGNSTWSMPKKPYKIKTGSSASILSMPADNEWVLLANYTDKTLLRNHLAFELGKLSRLEYTPRMKHVDVVLNGVYQGNYLFGEHLKVAESRIDIQELDENDSDESFITGGYHLEVDARLDEDFWFYTDSGIPITIKSPEDITEAQLAYIKDYIQRTENAILSVNTEEYENFINVETFIDWYWINELFKNNDAIFFSSVHMYKDRDEKLNLGPLWDFDIGAGNIDYNGNDNPSGWWIRNASWMKQLFNHSTFKQRAEDRWNELREEYITVLFSFIDEAASNINSSQQQNFYKWDILNTYVWPNAVVTGSYENEIAYLKKWLSARIEWIDAQINESAIVSFALQTPVHESRILVPEESSDYLTFHWTHSTPGSYYKLVADTLDGDFTNPIISHLADFYGFDTMANILISDLRSILTELNVQDSLELKWNVYSYHLTDSISAEQPFSVRLVNPHIFSKPIPVPVLHAPSENNVNQSLRPTFSWSKIEDAESYHLEISLMEDFTDSELFVMAITDTVHTINTELNYSTIYFWRVKAITTEGESEWSNPLAFTTNEIVGIEESFTGILLYPNPSESELTIDVSRLTDVTGIEIYNIMGQMVSALSVSEERIITVDVSGYPRGAYITVVKRRSNSRLVQKVILK